ncbi:TPA: CtsR family transcriptional regulator [Clostridium botulinum]|jgi:transcriptional regulator CtsR|uniref:Transcriptional regulator CtsR n=3 Tax=Clostridium TaxID=1485 RepID=A0AAE4Z5Q7_CLOSG|nr:MULTISPECIES: CtsR family transcriptional regulator [Clostridium]MBE6078589.1 CtsR family transcriptional regulator [Clostridium lundense]AVQ40508.1 CtsR family transcriptional regulator [Clostridium botulinum]AVQ47564.1 CtsR family transcriptional regulator [Clostridium botulinum]AVQ51113.1 CtsR family transcriptional regulator [Clostridium botulinum]EDU39005.1 transcriptional repressor of CtsR [Clostridium sporogenes ATCC 15579]
MIFVARLSDIIEDFIKEMFQENNESELQIKRNELANYFSCAPSQINYVLTTRFTEDKGYYIESKRGGGGCIIIRRIEFTNNKNLKELIVDRIGNSITYDNAINIIDGLVEMAVITEREAIIMKIAINDRVFGNIDISKNMLRANILKNIIMVII